MLGAVSFASRPLSASLQLPRPFALAAIAGEYGWAAWSYSRQAKLNAWTWHGLGMTNVNSWATLGNAIYMRRESDDLVHVLRPDVFLTAEETTTESSSVEATTQWLDFAKPGKRKALTGMDLDVQNVTTVEIYISENGGRTGTLAASLPLVDADGGWTYNGEMIPLEEVGAATEFMFRFIGEPNTEVQVNRWTLWYDEVQG